MKKLLICLLFLTSCGTVITKETKIVSITKGSSILGKYYIELDDSKHNLILVTDKECKIDQLLSECLNEETK